MGRTCALTGVVAAIVWAAFSVPDTLGAETPSLRVVVETRGGVYLVGLPAPETLPMHAASLGRIDVDLRKVDTIAFEANRETAVVTFLNGDQVRGALALGAIVVSTSRGNVGSQLTDVRRMTTLTGPSLRAEAGLAAYYPFSGDARDESGQGHHGRVHGAVLTRDRFGREKRAYLFDGADDYIEVPLAADLGWAPSLTVSAWIQRRPGVQNQHILRQGNFSNGKYRYGLVLFNGDDLSFNSHDGVTWFGAGAADLIEADRFYHLAGVYDSAAKTLELYVNGVRVAQRAEAGMNPAKGEPIMIGAERYKTIGNYFSGVIDDVRIYSRALSRSEVMDLFLLERQGAPRRQVVEPADVSVGTRSIARTVRSVSTRAARPFRPEEERRVVSRYPTAPPIETGDALNAEIDVLEALFRAGKISKQLYEAEVAAVTAKFPPTRRVHRLRGQLAALLRLYHNVQIDTDTFLKHYMPLWDEWYHIDNILPNGDFEDVEDRKVPEHLVPLAGWWENRHPVWDSGRSRMDLDRKVKHRGRQSLRFSNDRGPSNIYVRSAPFGCLRDDRLKIRFWVKAEGLKRGQFGRAAALYFHKSDGLILWLLVPEGTYDWTMMEARLNAFGNVPEGRTEQCHIEFQFHGEGTLWIDDITIVPTTRRPPVGDS